MHKKVSKWTTELIADAIKLYEEGVSSGEIAERLGIERSSVYDKISALKKQGIIKRRETGKVQNKRNKTENVGVDEEYIQYVEELYAKAKEENQMLIEQNEILSKENEELRGITKQMRKSENDALNSLHDVHIIKSLLWLVLEALEGTVDKEVVVDSIYTCYELACNVCKEKTAEEQALPAAAKQ